MPPFPSTPSSTIRHPSSAPTSPSDLSSLARMMSNPQLLSLIPLASMQPVLDVEAEVHASKKEEVAAYHRLNGVMFVMDDGWWMTDDG